MQNIKFTKSINTSFEFKDQIAHFSLDTTGALRIDLPYEAAFGGGERYHTVNLKGYRINIKVEEKFCEQFDKTYLPVPFFLTDSGFGLYVHSGEIMNFAFQDEFILLEIPEGAALSLFEGNPQEILSEYMSMFGKAVLPPDYAFLPWISANHWDSQKKAEQQIQLLEKYDFPAGVIVLEAWSDEATFYIFNGANYTAKEEGYLTYEDFNFPKDGPWYNPKEMVEKFHKAGLKVILWQIPVYKKQSTDEKVSDQNEVDRRKALENDYAVKLKNGDAYTIPEGYWFSGSMIPDFTNEAAKEDWFEKRRYLLDIGIDGFKTDGGEFVYREDIVFANGEDGKMMKNKYPQTYTQAYTDFLDEKHVLFSRAGYAGMHTTPIHWSGDQKSTFAELRAQLKAALSASMSGMLFWGQDIAGFAGQLPNADLYLRATQMAAFTPVMQWHSEPDGGQFSTLMASDDMENERSPWNIAHRSGDEKLLERTRFYHKLRASMQEELVLEAKRAVENNCPMMRPLAFDYMSDSTTHGIVDEYLFGQSYLVAPILTADTNKRRVYLPEGMWENFWTGQQYEGKQTIEFKHDWHIPVYKKVI